MCERPLVRQIVARLKEPRRFAPAASLVVGPAGMPLAEFRSLDPAELLR